MSKPTHHSGGGQQGPAFFIGDSIGVGLQMSGLLKGFSGFDATTSISLATSLANGIPQNDATQIRAAGSVVVELGTNQSSPFASDANKMVRAIGQINSNCAIFWLEIFSQTQNYTAENQVINSLSGVTVIPTLNLNISLADGIHPDAAGYQTLSAAINSAVKTGGAPQTGGGGTPGGGGGGTTGGGGGTLPEPVAKAASISTYLDFPGLEYSAESVALRGERSLLNDQQLLPFIEQLCQSSLRNFQSMPDGKFFGFFPDYFGGLDHRTPYWEIHDIEIINGQIQLSDDALATHVFVTGDTGVFDGQVTVVDEINTAGVATVFNAFKADFLNGVSDPKLTATPTTPPKGGNSGNSQAQQQAQQKTQQQEAAYQKQVANLPSLADKARAIAFLQKYGARPYREDAPMVRSHFFEMFLAYQKFMLMWSRQFITTFEFTFMPELFPGGIVSFPEHGIQCFIDEVVHNCDYEGGFTTQANLSAPAALPGSKDTKPKRYVHEGMIRAAVWANATTPTPPTGSPS